MGIRFYCPNGHKLNVKEFQAGRRGICPFCGARTMIPLQSTRPATKAGRRQGAGGAATQTLEHDDPDAAQGSDSSPDILPGEPPQLPGDPTGGKMLGPSTQIGSSPAGPIVAPPSNGACGPVPTLPAAAGGPASPSARPHGPASPSPQPVGAARGLPAKVVNGGPATVPGATRPDTVPNSATSPAGAAAMPSPTAATPAKSPTFSPSANGPAGTAVAPPPTTSEPPDPIAEAPEMIWYVRPPSGGQFGPAPGELMKTWLNEGRVSGDSLVWREGWRDWQEAAKVFPKLRGNQIIDFLEAAPVVAAATPAAHAHRPKPRHSSDHKQIALVVGLSLLVIMLFVVLLLLLVNK